MKHTEPELRLNWLTFKLPFKLANTLITKKFGRAIFGRFFSQFRPISDKFSDKISKCISLTFDRYIQKLPHGTLTIEADRGVPQKRVLFIF